MRVGDRPNRLVGVSLPGREGAFDLELAGGRVVAINPSQNPSEGGLVLPAFVDLHLHADRAYLRSPVRAGSLEEAVRMTTQLRKGVSVADIRERSGSLLGRALSHGTVRVRSHVDVDDVVEWRSLEAVLAVREEMDGLLDLEVAAFATALVDPAEPEARERLRQALQRGADLLGGVVRMYRDPAASSRALLNLAAEADVALDVHVDETLQGEDTWIDYLAKGAVERGLSGRLTVSHGCLLSRLPMSRAEEVIGTLVEARATVVALPATNLYLQDRGSGTPRLRGLTLLQELAAAGVPVRLGSDNVGDSFYPYGDADPLEAAFLAAVAAHLDDEALLLGGISDGRTGVGEGDPADLVVVQATSVTEALSRRPTGRMVLRHGTVVASGSA